MQDPYREPIEDKPGPAPRTSPEKTLIPEIKEQARPQEKPLKAPSPPILTAPVSPPPPPSAQPAPTQPPVPASNIENEDRQLKMLVDLAFSQGIDKAVEAARASGDAYLIDKFHDTLVDELHQQLVEKGKLKEG